MVPPCCLLAVVCVVSAAVASPALPPPRARVSQEMHGVAEIRKVDQDHHTVDLLLNGQTRSVHVADDVRVIGRDGRPLAAGLAAPELAPGTTVQVTAIPGAGGAGPTIIELRVAPGSVDAVAGSGGAGAAPAPRVSPDVSRLIALPELGAAKYEGVEGGLYPGGKNERPAAHERSGIAFAHQVQPLDAEGHPSAGGRIVLLSIGMSNTLQAFEGFTRVARGDPRINPLVVLVNGAQNGVTARAMRDANDGATGARYWAGVDGKLRAAGVTDAQVQAIWIKQADANPREDFQTYARTLESELGDIVRIVGARFPNVKLVYLSSRTFGGFARSTLNPEPYAYWSGFAVKWLIEAQLAGDPTLTFDPARGAVKAPWLSWGPYLWANGGFTEADFAADGTHESPSGQEKVGRLLLEFFATDSTSQPWFVKPATR